MRRFRVIAVALENSAQRLVPELILRQRLLLPVQENDLFEGDFVVHELFVLGPSLAVCILRVGGLEHRHANGHEQRKEQGPRRGACCRL